MKKQHVQLKDICDVLNGYAFKSSNYVDGGIRVIRITNVQKGYIEDNAPQYYPLESEKEIEKYLLHEGDLLMSLTGNVGRVALLKKEMLPAALNQRVACLRLKKSANVYKPYLFHLLNSDFFESQCIFSAQGIAQKNMSTEWLKEYQIPLYSLEKQKAIADLFDKTDALIKRRKKQQCKLNELLKSRFIELFGDLADPNCQWKKEKIVDVCRNPDDIKCGPFGTQLSKDEYYTSGVAVWEIPQINSGFTTQPIHFLTVEKANQLEAYSLRSGDIAMSRKGNVGRCAVFPETMEDGIIHSDVLRIRINNDLVLPVFLMHQLHYSGAVQHQIELVSSGAIMAGINVTKLKQIVVHIPPMELQQQFAAFVAQVDKSKSVVQKSLQELETLKKSLMQQYFG